MSVLNTIHEVNESDMGAVETILTKEKWQLIMAPGGGWIGAAESRRRIGCFCVVPHRGRR